MSIAAESPMTRGSFILELSAADDLPGFRRAVEEDQIELDLPAPWYGRWGKTMGFELRTPLMIAAMYGSIRVLEYILTLRKVDVNRSCGSDGATALHCAAAGGSPAAADAARMLVYASADIGAVNGEGNKPGDVIPRGFASVSSSKAKSLKNLLGTAGEEEASSKTEEKKREKEYPPDLTLPDMKNGIYSTDEFRMYSFKVKPCSRAYSHDWTECPFAHPGENARRRDPRKYQYSCVPCPEFRKGSCRSGDACEYAHGVFESWLHPAQYRTRLCKDETGCTRRVCFFAHKPEELRQPGHASLPGSALPSPRSSALPAPDVNNAAAASSAAAAWLSQAAGLMTPSSKMPASRLKTSLSCRNMEVDLDMMGLEAYRQQQMDDMSAISSSSGWNFSLGGTASPPPGFGDVYGSSPESEPFSLRQFQTPSGIPRHQSNNIVGRSNSPPINSSFGQHALASTILKAKAAAFAKRSQSFCDRRTTGRPPVPSAAASYAEAAPPSLSDWASPDGKLDWGIRSEELSKLRKCASFGLRSNGNAAAVAEEEPNACWVRSLVTDTGAEAPRQRQSYEAARSNKLFSPWMDQEQMVA